MDAEPEINGFDNDNVKHTVRGVLDVPNQTNDILILLVQVTKS